MWFNGFVWKDWSREWKFDWRSIKSIRIMDEEYRKKKGWWIVEEIII